MIGFKIHNGFIDFTNTSFSCPSCNEKYEDNEDKYVEKINESKDFIIKIKCICKQKFNLTVNYMGDYVTFN